jgi:hypothetical protein
VKFSLGILTLSILLNVVNASAGDTNQVAATPSANPINRLPNPFGAFNLVMYAVRRATRLPYSSL